MFHQFELSQVYHPTRTMDYPPETAGSPVEEVSLTASDGVRLHAWYFRGATNSPRARFAVLYCHGNGGNISSRPGYYRAILESGVNLLAFDYRGFGQSEGSPNEPGTYLDARAGLAWLTGRGFAASNVIAWGESLGGGIASEVAAGEPLGGLVLQSAFTSIPDIGSELFPFLPVRSVGKIKYDTHARLPGIRCPVMVMHSRADTTIPYHHGEKNFAAANQPKLFWALAGNHNDVIKTNRARFVDGFEEFVKLIESTRGAPIK